MLSGIGKTLVSRHYNRIIVKSYYALKTVHRIGVEILPYCIIGIEEFCLAVGYKVMYVVGLEFMQNRHGHSSVGYCRNECDSPL